MQHYVIVYLSSSIARRDRNTINATANRLMSQDLKFKNRCQQTRIVLFSSDAFFSELILRAQKELANFQTSVEKLLVSTFTSCVLFSAACSYKSRILNENNCKFRKFGITNFKICDSRIRTFNVRGSFLEPREQPKRPVVAFQAE